MSVHAAEIWANYVIPAYVLTVGGLAGLLGWSWVAMRRAEGSAERLRGERRR